MGAGHWRVLSAPSICTALPLVSVAANSEALPNTTQRCQVTLDLYSPDSGSFQLRFVASERIVRAGLGSFAGSPGRRGSVDSSFRLEPSKDFPSPTTDRIRWV